VALQRRSAVAEQQKSGTGKRKKGGPFSVAALFEIAKFQTGQVT
jgi:hypothetical protein